MPNNSTSAQGSYVSSLKNHLTGRLNWPTLLVTYVPPIAAGLGMWLSGWRIPNVSDYIAGIAIIAGFLFALLIFVFQLRLQVSHDPRIQQRTQVPVLIDELFSTALLATGVAVAFTITLLIAASTAGFSDAGDALPLSQWVSIVIASMGALLCALLFVVGIKTSVAYRTASNGSEISH